MNVSIYLSIYLYYYRLGFFTQGVVIQPTTGAQAQYRQTPKAATPSSGIH